MAAHLLEDERQLDHAHPHAAVLLGDRDALQAERPHLLPDGRVVALDRLDRGADPGDGRFAAEELAGQVAQSQLVLRELEVHADTYSRLFARRSLRTSRGRPSTRSPMMFFWICDEPA